MELEDVRLKEGSREEYYFGLMAYRVEELKALKMENQVVSNHKVPRLESSKWGLQEDVSLLVMIMT